MKVVGDRVQLRTKKPLDETNMGTLRWDGLLAITACPSPKTCTLALPRRMLCSPTVKVALPRVGRHFTGLRARYRIRAGE